jgi:nucleotide-binding universal stress UspA family protein
MSRDAAKADRAIPVALANGEGEILVALAGDELDDEVMALACTLARMQGVRVRAVYGIAVPRCRAVDDEMPTERAKAESALARAGETSRRCGVAIETECVQSRDMAESLVRIAKSGGCGLLVVGVRREADGADDEGLPKMVADVLKQAPCRVWLVRGQSLAA